MDSFKATEKQPFIWFHLGWVELAKQWDPVSMQYKVTGQCDTVELLMLIYLSADHKV